MLEETYILVVDDEIAERITLGEVLRLEGYRITLAASGEEAVAHIKQGPAFQAVILDLRLPGIDGLQVLEAIHHHNPETLVILITGYGTLETAIQAMRKGAYDYLLKPCPVEEILTSLRRGLSEKEQNRHRHALIERLQDTVRQLVESEHDVPMPQPPPDERFLQVRNITIDRAKHLVTRGGAPIELTPTEFKLLEYMIQRVDQVCTPQELVRFAQGYEADAWGARSIVRVHVRRLRSKLEPKPERPQYIMNVRGVGYMFASRSEPKGRSK